MKTRWQDWFNLAFGSWLFCSPWLLQYITGRPYMTQTAVTWNSIVFGAITVYFTIRILYVPKDRGGWEEWGNLILGLWLLASPWALGFYTQTLATANIMVVGLVITILSASVLARRHFMPAIYRHKER